MKFESGKIGSNVLPTRSGVAKVLLREPEVAREPVFMIRGRFSECKGEECKDGAVFFE